MKITLNVDCTPAEARSFFGLPEIEALQQRLLEKMETQLENNLSAMDMQKLSESLMKNFVTPGGPVPGWERWQELFANIASGAAMKNKAD